jgi:two-component system sensor histidine kinase LytS
MAFLTGVIAESAQMLIILLIAKPFNLALVLVQMIAIPMILTNSVGIAVFVAIIKSVVDKEDKIEAAQTQKVLQITDEMLSHLRKGLNSQSAYEVLKIIHQASKVPAVGILDGEKVLAHVGAGEDRQKAGKGLSPEMREKVLVLHQITIINDKEEINCLKPGCPLEAAILVPMRKREELIGVLCFYYRNVGEIKPVDKEFSHQLEVAEAEKQAALLNVAEIKALQAQVNPHFLFNSLNTIVALIRTNPDMARNLLIQLGNFFRQNINAYENESIDLEQELKHTRAYLNIEKVRFSDRLSVQFIIDQNLNGVNIPPLTLQPIVENALKYGLGDIPQDGVLIIRADKVENRARISVQDNGSGFPFEKANDYLWKRSECQNRSSLGLYNVNQRLVGIFGPDSQVHIQRPKDGGTMVWFDLPMKNGEKNGD